jgi:hypothetical protein
MSRVQQTRRDVVMTPGRENSLMSVRIVTPLGPSRVLWVAGCFAIALRDNLERATHRVAESILRTTDVRIGLRRKRTWRVTRCSATTWVAPVLACHQVRSELVIRGTFRYPSPGSNFNRNPPRFLPAPKGCLSSGETTFHCGPANVVMILDFVAKFEDSINSQSSPKAFVVAGPAISLGARITTHRASPQFRGENRSHGVLLLVSQ